ncbi:MAG: lipid biosynthesis B12-binding/radical SAM protein, partial [Thermodesulfobacteriota bacterium]
MTHSCLIISANQVVSPYPVYPLGAAHLLGTLEKHGISGSHFDMLADGLHDGLREHLLNNNYDAVALSIRNLETVDSSIPDRYLDKIVTTMEIIRSQSDAPVVIGGSGFSILPETVLEVLGGDYGVVGEGEVLFPWLLEEIFSGRPPQQKLFYADPEQYPWDQPIYSPTAADYYIRHGGMLNIQTKRGCPYNCAYCSYPVLEGRRLRLRDPEEIANEVARLTRDHGARYIFFTDSVFNDHSGHFRHIAEALIKTGNKTPWCGFFRPKNLSTDDLRLLKRSGLAAMEIGTDGACDTTLAALNKGFSFSDVEAVNKRVTAEGIPCAHFVMFGGPGESEQTLEEGLANLDRLEDCLVFAYAGIRIFPDTEIHRLALSEAVITSDT